MKIKSLVKLITVLPFMGGSVCYGQAVTENFPSSDSNAALYYRIGGGRSVPISAVEDNSTIPIDAEGSVGLNFSCGKFNPQFTIANSLNNFEDSVQNVEKSVVTKATSAMIHFPMYKLAQADPKLYNLLNNNVVGAHKQFAIKIKSCEEMQSEALQGENPYNDWATVSRNNNMKSTMSYGNGDLNKAMAKVDQQQGDSGVPWATPGQALGDPAGGMGQAPIMVIHDVMIAGYNVMLGRDATETTAPSHTDKNYALLNYWGSPENAATWVVSVVGDQKITTCSDASCVKRSTPGAGLLPDVQKSTMGISTKLATLVSDPAQVDEASLLAVSAPGQMVSQALLDNIRQMNVNAQSNTVGTLAQNIATTRIVNEALLAIDVLQMGSEVPNIHAVGPAQKVIAQKIKRLQSDINHIMYSVTIRRQLNANVMRDIMRYSQAQNAAAAAIPEAGDQPALLSGGAIVKKAQS